MEIDKILAPTDFSDLSLAGLRYALKHAKSNGAELISESLSASFGYGSSGWLVIG